jgi:hypothetical protein
MRLQAKDDLQSRLSESFDGRAARQPMEDRRCGHLQIYLSFYLSDFDDRKSVLIVPSKSGMTRRCLSGTYSGCKPSK